MVCENRQKPELQKDGFMGALLPQSPPPTTPLQKHPCSFCHSGRNMVVLCAVVFVIVIPVLVVFFVFFATVVIINRPGVARAVLQTPLLLIDLLIKLVILFLQTSKHNYTQTVRARLVKV